MKLLILTKTDVTAMSVSSGAVMFILVQGVEFYLLEVLNMLLMLKE